MKFTTKKNLIEEFEKRGFKCLGRINPSENGEMNLYHKNEGYVNYHSTITWDSKKKKVKFNGNYYSDIDELLQAIEEYNKTLFFDADTYDPDMVDDCRTDIRMSRDIRRIGGELDDGYDYSNYKVHDAIGNVLLNIHQNMNCISIDDIGGGRNVPTSSWVKFFDETRGEFTDEQKVIQMRSTLYVSLVTQMVKILQTINKLGEFENMKKSFDLISLHGIRLKTENFNDTIINELKNAIKMLEK